MNLAHTLTQAALKWPNKTPSSSRTGAGPTHSGIARSTKQRTPLRHGVGKGDRVAIFTLTYPSSSRLLRSDEDRRGSGADEVQPGRERSQVHRGRFARQDFHVRRGAARAGRGDQGYDRGREACICGRNSGRPRILFEYFHHPGAGREAEADVGWHDRAFIMYTSGTTGGRRAWCAGTLPISWAECSFPSSAASGTTTSSIITSRCSTSHNCSFSLSRLYRRRHQRHDARLRCHEPLSLVGAEPVKCCTECRHKWL